MNTAIKGDRPKPGSQASYYKVRACTECGSHFHPTRKDALFCEPACKAAFHNMELIRAKALYRRLYHWRAKRGTKDSGFSFSQVSAAVDAWIREDKEKGRKAPAIHD